MGGEESRDPIRSCREGAGAPVGSPFRSGAVSGAVRLLADMEEAEESFRNTAPAGRHEFLSHLKKTVPELPRAGFLREL